MQQPDPAALFNQQHAAEYDKRFAKVSAMRDVLHLYTGALFADLPEEARILCVGAGTGQELIYLAQKFPRWHFTAVEPSAPMLEVCRRRTEELGIASRCTFHVGYVESLPDTAAYDAATSLLVSQFILSPEARTDFFRAIAQRLHPGGLLVSADLAADLTSEPYQRQWEVWFKVMRVADIPPEKLENMRAAYGRDVALLPVEQVSSLIVNGGFETPVLFLQTGLIHGWYAQKARV